MLPSILLPKSRSTTTTCWVARSASRPLAAKPRRSTRPRTGGVAPANPAPRLLVHPGQRDGRLLAEPAGQPRRGGDTLTPRCRAAITVGQAGRSDRRLSSLGGVPLPTSAG